MTSIGQAIRTGWTRSISSKYIRSASVLLLGTGAAQIVPVALSPLLTRIYEPADFGAFVLFSSLASIAGIAATGRYEHAILLPRSRSRALSVVLLTIFLSAVLAGIIGLAIVIGRIVGWEFSRQLAWLFLPIYICLFGPIQALTYLSNRYQQFKSIARARFIQASTAGLFQVILGIAGAREVGLMIGTLAGQFTGAASLVRNLRLRWSRIRFRDIIQQGNRYRRFPLFSLPADLINTAANQLPLFFLTAKFGMEVGGFFGLTQRVLGLPINLLAGSISDVFKNAAAAEFKKNGNCKRIYLKTFTALFLASIIPFGFFAAFAPWVFATVFGKEWAEAGFYARILAVFYFFRFTASPLSYVMYIAEKQTIDLLWQIGLFLVILLAMTIGDSPDPRSCLLRYSVAYSGMYILYLFLSYRFASGKK